MSERERIPFWQVWRLRLRALQGWGYDVSELRQYARANMLMARALLVLVLFSVALFVTIFNILPRFGIGEPRPLPFAATLRLSLVMIVTWLPLIAIAAGVGVARRRRAEAGAHQPSITLAGSCFATASAPPTRLFALIGMTREHAQWFCLPITWDTTVEPGDDRFEMTYTPATGYVERLRRIGAEPLELRQGADAPTSAGEVAEADTTDGEGTPMQRRNLKRDFRRAGMAWGVATSSLLSTGLAFLLGGISFIAMIVFVLVLLRIYPQPHTQATDMLAVAVFCATLGLLGIGFLIWGARVLRIWAQRRRADAEPPLVLAGEQICWAPYRDLYSARGESLALVRLDDGDQRIFRIPARWAHRLWSEHSRVRVTYNEQTWLVLDYRPVDAAPTSTSA